MTPTAPDLPTQVAARYRGRFAQGFVRSKLRTDPMLGTLLAGPPLGAVLDLGCGRGQLALAVLLAGVADSVTGLDADARKIAAGQDAAGDLAASFRTADIAEAALPPADTVLLIDVLYQMPPGRQEALLGRLAQHGARRVVIRAFDPDRGWRSTVGRTMETARRLVGADLGRRGVIAPRPLDDLAAPLRAAGYAVSITPPSAGTLLPNVLLLAQRP
ncbi:class I SAM-dependent methyltransferase [Roseomonas sp. HJA6]|uniref:Class I SAM-dependent methyltransferase n=1 Tax=Roseomonas alba TaxID=2846776 RepID=A0ABS7A7I0_9PROT|nr:class I SAM-dependent methyltransferase [Neoroseomonas alba]MBW6398085.1 class I SAM-dependent methyltransferase [Neoroseomonas alba]